MRLALTGWLVLVLVLAGAARADVFVPADPPPLRSAVCSAGAGDVVVAGTVRDNLRVSVGGGGWRELALSGCPVVAAAADGTAAIAGSGDRSGVNLVVRGPGGEFGVPIALGANASIDPPAVAAAPGGWIAAALVTESGVVVLVVRPDGTSERTVLERATSKPGLVRLSNPRIGIDAGGNVTVIWQRIGDGRLRWRVARGVTGAVAVADLPTGTESALDLVLAAAPGGGTLFAWADGSQLYAMVDGQLPQVVGRADPEWFLLAAAMADDGTALLAVARQRNEIAVTERVAGTWRVARVVGQASAPANYDESQDQFKTVLATVAPGGRAAVAWSTLRDDGPQVFAASGQVGGAWAAETRLSSATRYASTPSLALDAAGVPHALWIDGELGVRGATLAPARLDAVAPAVTARLPSRLPPTVDGNVEVTVRVRCSEACDAQLAFDPRPIDGGVVPGGDVVKALEAGRAADLHVRVSRWLQWDLVAYARARRLPLRLVVTDRAGNVVRRSVTLRVRVVKAPVRSFKVAPGHRFGMKTRAGDRSLARLVNDIIEAVARGHVSDRTLERRYARGLKAIAREFGAGSTTTQEVESAIYDALWLPFARTGHNPGSILNA